MTYLAQAFKSAPILIILSIFIVYLEFNAPLVFSSHFGRVFDAREPFTLGFLVIYTLVCLLFLPVLLTKSSSRETLKELGLVFPEKKVKACFLILASLLLLIPVVFYSAKYKEVQIFYSLKKLGPAAFVGILCFALPPYYLAEEFFFRGFLFMRLWKKLNWHSYWITELIFTWAHLGKPAIEVLLAFPVGIVLNYITLQTKSIYPAMAVHFTMGALMNILVTYFV